MHRAQPLVQLDEVLTMLEALEQVALGTLLSMCQRLEDAMPLEQARDVVEALLKTGLRPCGCHRGPTCSATMIGRRTRRRTGATHNSV